MRRRNTPKQLKQQHKAKQLKNLQGVTSPNNKVGYVYIMINASFPKNVLKIGMTKRDPYERAEELSNKTGLPAEFQVAYEKRVQDCEKAERRIHKELKQYRTTAFRNDRSREFFQMPLKQAIPVVERICMDIGVLEKEIPVLIKQEAPVLPSFPVKSTPIITVDEQVFVNQIILNRDPAVTLRQMRIVPKDASQEEIERTVQQYLKNPRVQEALLKAKADQIQRLRVTDNSVIAQLSRFAFIDPLDLYDSRGQLKPLKKIPYEARVCIQSIETSTQPGRRGAEPTRITKVKLNSQIDALKTLLEKIILKDPPKDSPIQIGTVNIQNNAQINNTQTINPKQLTKEQVQSLLELRGYKQTVLGYQPSELPNKAEADQEFGSYVS